MVSSVTFRGGETTGGVSDRKIETAKQETTGGVGARKNQESIFNTDSELKQDTVCFRGDGDNSNTKNSTGARIAFIIADAAILMGLLGLAHKYDLVGKIKHEKTQKFMRHTDAVTKPCREACAWVKHNCYDKVVNFIKSKKS